MVPRWFAGWSTLASATFASIGLPPMSRSKTTPASACWRRWVCDSKACRVTAFGRRAAGGRRLGTRFWRRTRSPAVNRGGTVVGGGADHATNPRTFVARPSLSLHGTHPSRTAEFLAACANDARLFDLRRWHAIGRADADVNSPDLPGAHQGGR